MGFNSGFKGLMKEEEEEEEMKEEDKEKRKEEEEDKKKRKEEGRRRRGRRRRRTRRRERKRRRRRREMSRRRIRRGVANETWCKNNKCKEIGLKLDDKRRYDHVPKSVETIHEGKVTTLWNQQVRNDRTCEMTELILTINRTS